MRLRGELAEGEVLERGTRRHAGPLLAFVAVLACVLVLTVGAISLIGPPVPRAPTIRAAASQVLLNVSDISEVGWGERGSGTNGSGAWRLFAVHNELILATLNVTLWIEPNATAALDAMDATVRNVSYGTQNGGVPGADASAFWTFNFGQYAGAIVRRYNAVFLLSAHLESSFALTKSDLARWAGWQLIKIEAWAV